MKVTYDIIEQKFNEFNRLIFGGELPPILYLPSRASTYLGRYECEMVDSPLDGKKMKDHRMRINVIYDFAEDELEDIIIHEMIHYYISYKDMKDTSAHGTIFRSMMNDINERFGRHITISKRRTEKMVQEDTRVRRHYFCVMDLPDGRQAFTPVTQQSMFTLWTMLPEAFKATSSAWYVSVDPFFNSYRRLSAAHGRMPRLRTYPIERNTLEPHLQKAVRLERKGNTISPIRK